MTALQPSSYLDCVIETGLKALRQWPLHKTRLESTWSSEKGLGLKEGDFFLNEEDFFLKEVDFFLKEVDFFLREADFSLNVVDFSLKEVDLNFKLDLTLKKDTN